VRALTLFSAKCLLNPTRTLFARSGRLASFFLVVICMACPLNSVAAVSITVAPSSVNLSPGGAQQFTASVTGAADTSITWSIQPAAGGTILASGRYTAPAMIGSYSVIATSNADSTQSATATVSVAGFTRTGLLNASPLTATLLTDGTVLYTDGGISSAEIYNPATLTSTATGSMSISRVKYTATLLQNGKVLIAGGQTSGQATAVAEIYDPVGRTFAATGSLMSPREAHSATLLPDVKVLIVGGDKGNCTSSCFYNTAELYDPAAGSFSPTAGSLPVPPAIPAAAPLATAAAVLLPSGKVLIAGGGIGGSAELFDPATGLFTQTGGLVNQGDGFSATLLQSGKVLFVTGGISEAAGSTAEIYDPNSGSFVATGTLKLARGFDTATLLNNGQVLIVGGWSTAAAEIFDPGTATFSLTGSVEEARVGQVATPLADGTVLVAGGSAPFDGIHSVEVYDPAAKSFSSKSSFLKFARADHASAQLADGRLLLTGGEDFALNVLSSAEIYDPTTGISSLTGSMVQARHGHTATLLPNGNVLIVGGFIDGSVTGNGTTLASTAEIYNPVSGAFTLTASPIVARAYHTATLLPNGQVLIAGGATLGGSPSPTSTVELYEPVGQTFTQAKNMMSAVRYNHAAILMNDGRVLISDGLTVAGSFGSGVGLDEIYDPNTPIFTQVGPKEVTTNPTAQPTASILLQSGQVLADNQSIFNPGSNSLTTLTSLLNLQTLLQNYEFALLPGGQVLATSNSYPTYLFDPVAETFSQGDSLQYHRSRPTLYVLPNHDVMVAGGASVAQLEFYVPAAANSNPTPGLSSLNPSAVVAGGVGFTQQVNGSNFVSNSVVNFDGEARPTIFVSGTQLSISILPGDISNAGTATITVTNPASGSAGAATSNPLTLTILAANIQPVLGVLSPASTTAGGPAFTLVVAGNGFTQNSAVTFNGSPLTLNSVSGTQLQVNVPSNAIAVAGSYLVAVANQGGSLAAIKSFTVNNPIPQESLLSPSSVTAGSAGVTLTVAGTNFNSSSQVWINGAARPTTFVNPNSLKTALSTSDVMQAATLQVSINNPGPFGGGITSTLPFTVTDYSVAVPAPSVTVNAGQTAVFNLVVAPSNGAFANPITFTIAPSPPAPGTSASFSPSAMITPGSTSQTVTLSIATTAHTVSFLHSLPALGGSIALLLSFAGTVIALGGLIWTAKSRAPTKTRSLVPRLLFLVLLIGAAGMAACSTGGGSTSAVPQVNTSTGTPAGTYAITVTATSGGIAHTAAATVTVI
jgi:hypothetical protein